MKWFFLLWILFLLLMSCSNSQTGEMLTQNNTSAEVTQEPITILALWDSLTAGYGLEITESYPSKLQNTLTQNGYNYTIINGWVSGDTSKNLLDRAALYQEKNPEIVLLVIGWNDGLRGQSVDDLQKNIQAIIDMYAWSSQIVLGGMEIPANFWMNYAKQFKQIYFDLAKNNPNVYFLESFLKDVGWIASLNQADRIHPTSEWYDIIVANIFSFLQQEKIIKK